MKAKSSGQPRNPSNELLAGLPVSDWPAKELMKLADKILQGIENRDIGYLEENFSSHMVACLWDFWPGIEVYWSPARQKSKDEELKRRLEKLRDIDPVKNILNSLIIDLNKNYHSVPFLRQLTCGTEMGKSGIFKIWPDNNGINFLSLGTDNQEESPWHFRSDMAAPLSEFVNGLLLKYKNSFIENRKEKAAVSDIDDYLVKWADFQPNITSVLQNHGPVPINDIMAEAKNAMQHFALMSLYIVANNCSAVSYFISITPDSEHDSSMVIYWPSGNVPDNTLHYLLKMLLGLNASPILNAIEQRNASYELMEYFGHSMKNRLAPIMQYCDDKKSRNNARRSVHLISDSMVLLRLKRVQSVEDLFANDKTRDFLLKAVPENKPLDIYKKLRTEWKKIIDGSEGLVKLDSGNQVAAIYKIKVPPSKDASNAIVSFGLRRDQDHYRLSDHVYRELFLELLLNICRHSQANEIVYDEKRKKYKAHIEVQLNWSHVDNKSVLILSNFVGSNKLPGYLNETTWTPWPYGRSHSGPGMAISFLRRLKLGDIWYLRQHIDDPSIVSGERLHVAVHLDGFPRSNGTDTK